MKQRGVFLIGLILISVYYFLFPRVAGKELIVNPDALTDLGSGELNPGVSSLQNHYLPVRNSRHAAFLGLNHEMLYQYFSDRMAIGNDWIAVSEGDELSLMEPDGSLIARIDDYGYPVAVDGRLFLYRSDTGILSKIDPAIGTILWRKECISDITVIDSRQGRTLIGYLDGRVQLIDDSGSIILEYRPGGSRIEAIYAGGLSEDGSKIALVCGLDPQRFVLLEERKNGFRPIAHHDTGTDFRRPVFLSFVRNGRQVLYENNGFAEVVDLNDYDTHSLGLPGKLAVSIDNPVEGTLLLFGKDKNNTMMRILSRYDLSLFESSVPSDISQITGDRNYALLIGDSSVAVLEFSVQ